MFVKGPDGRGKSIESFGRSKTYIASNYIFMQEWMVTKGLSRKFSHPYVYSVNALGYSNYMDLSDKECRPCID